MPSVNRQITLVSRPVGLPKESDFQLLETPLPEPGAGEVLVRGLYLSLDAHTRGRLGGKVPYSRPVNPGDVITGEMVGQVVRSNDPRVAKDDIVEGMLGWQEYAVAPAKSLRKIDPAAGPITTSLHVLGLPGLTAFFGLLDICRPQPGETVIVSGAGGAIGSLVGQIARIKRCRAIGITGGDEKIGFLTTELGFDGGFNFRTEADPADRLKQLCPNGVDVYFDTIGGAVTDAVMRLLNTRARIAICGQCSQYDTDEPQTGPRWFSQLITKQAKVEGFVVQQFAERFEEAMRQLAIWMHEKRIRYREDIVVGLENAPRAFIGTLQGESLGKPLVKVAV